ncbi:hypothetical protein, partial [Dysgonomonas sp.]
IRTEVIKKQSEILSKFLEIIKDNNQSFENGLDYVNLVNLNVLLVLKDFGFIFKEHEEITNKIVNDIAGWIPCSKSIVLEDIEIISTFNKQDSVTVEPSDYSVRKYNKLKDGILDLDKVYITKQHSSFVKLLSEYRENPFMPSSIQKIFEELLNDIQNNLSIVLKAEIECFILDFSKPYFETGNCPKFNPIGIYNNFNHSRVHHKELLNKLRKEIRQYLRIDENW